MFTSNRTASHKDIITAFSGKERQLVKANSKHRKFFPLAPLTLNQTSQQRLSLNQTRHLSPRNVLKSKTEDGPDKSFPELNELSGKTILRAPE